MANNGDTSSAFRSASIQEALWRVASQLVELPGFPAEGFGLDRLAELFDLLAEGREAARARAEEGIWSIWCDHPTRELKDRMDAGIRCLHRGELSDSERIFDALIREDPSWAEAWNKRATIYFLQDRDTASVDDIYCTLEREPRHFGALGGLAQIGMRNDEAEVARAALERLLLVHPRAPGVAQAVQALSARADRTLH